MKLICSLCGRPIDAVPGPAVQRIACPHCGGVNVLTATEPVDDGLRAPESEFIRVQEKRRRDTVLVGVAICGLLSLLAWLLVQPSGVSSAGRALQNAVFGQRVTEAVQQARGQGQGQVVQPSGSSSARRAVQNAVLGQRVTNAVQQSRGQGQDQGQGQRQGQGQGQSGQAGQAGAAGQRGTSAQSGQQGGNANNSAAGQSRYGSPGTPLDDPVNPQLPENNGPELDAPEARSIGLLDRFFGQQRQSNGPIRPGEGGTSENAPGAGNTNATPFPPPPEQIAAESTRAETNPLATGQTEPLVANRPRRTNAPAPARPNDLRDNLEELLRQHHAGSGDVRISLMWNNRNDLDLHVVDPNGEEINYQHRRSRSGGVLDIDMNAGAPLRAPAVENVFWPVNGAPRGTYKVYVNFYSKHDTVNQTAFTIRVLIRGRTSDFTGTIGTGQMKKLVHQFTL